MPVRRAHPSGVAQCAHRPHAEKPGRHVPVMFFQELLSRTRLHLRSRRIGAVLRQLRALMEHWRSVLPPGVTLEMQYEDVVADLEGQARWLIQVIDADWLQSSCALVRRALWDEIG